MRHLLFLLLSFSSLLFAEQHEPFEIFTVHKCGTHLVLKLFKEMKALDPEFYGYQTTYHHFCGVKDDKIDEVVNSAKFIVVVRDPRAQIVSLLNYIDMQCVKQDNPNFFPKRAKKWQRLTQEEKLELLIARNESKIPFDIKLVEMDWERSKKYYNHPNALLIRYENLVGEAGGGSREKQIAEIKRLLDHISYTYSDEMIETVATNLWGIDNLQNPDLGKTFYKGRVDTWRQFFDAERETAFLEDPYWNSLMSSFRYF